tara:strand:+ start:82 stop:192 length:111 start_codon:yes stop_codon:yes gene_type:complete
LSAVAAAVDQLVVVAEPVVSELFPLKKFLQETQLHV